MLQVIQYQKTGEMFVEELPVPALRQGGVLVRNHFSLVSAGTERSSVETAQASILGKAKKRPDLVKQVKDNIKREGLLTTWQKVKTRLDNYAQLGYSSAGTVVESSVSDFKPGDIVACAGMGYASHAEVVFVPKNLVAKIPQHATFEQAAFTTLGAIALQGVRQADLRIGENVAVIGLGLLGLITVQLLKANGCRVIGLDISNSNFELAKKLGCDDCIISNADALPAIESFTRGYGTDAVIITAATQSNEPVELAIEMARKKSAIVIVGAVSMNLPRTPFYQKELDFRISCSYGPGRYDAAYEEEGVDYPIGYVRWTENRNMQAVLDLIAMGKLDVDSLITHRFSIKDALGAYDLITGKTKEPYLGILISYPETREKSLTRVNVNTSSANGQLSVSFIGAGNFAQSNLLPPLKGKVSFKNVMTASPVEAKSVAKKFGFENCVSQSEEVLKDTDAVFIATRHDSHAKYVLESLMAGKHVFVEKPLAVTENELLEIKNTYEKHAAPNGQQLMVGFNRRFSKPFRDIKEFFSPIKEPLLMTYRVNAGFLPKDHWTQLPGQGGRIIGEGCHFIDCMSYLCKGLPVSVFAQSIASQNAQVTDADNVAITVQFDNGSLGTLIYTANGDKGLAKEYCEVFGGGCTAIMDNFSSVSFFANGKRNVQKYDGGKGHTEEVQAFIKNLNGKSEQTISFESLVDTTLVTLKALDSLKTRLPQPILIKEQRLWTQSD